MDLAQEHKPVNTPLPPPPSTDFLTDAQWEIFYALLDGVLPAYASASSATGDVAQISVNDDEFEHVLAKASRSLLAPPNREALSDFFKSRPLDDPKFKDDIQRTLAISPKRAELAKFLSIIGTRPGSLLCTGYWSPVDKQPASVREAIIKSWTTARTPAFKSIAKTVCLMAQKAYCLSSPLFAEVSGYGDVPLNWKAGQGYDYSFIQPPAGTDEAHVIETDVVIVGSGCGGGVSAKNIAQAGSRVIVVDKGYYFPPSHLPMPQSAAANYLFDHGGVYLTEDGGVGVACGGSWGGGGTVNWSVCLRLQDYVRKEWASEGLPMFATKDFDDCMDRISEFAGVGTSAIRHNYRNNMILDGSEKLGWSAKPAPQNTAGKEHYCGQCHLGCGSAEKRGPAVSWLPAAGDAGAEFMEGFQVDRVLFSEDGVTAVGVEGLWTSRDSNGQVHTDLNQKRQRRVKIMAKKVVISAGSLWSPVLLKKSGITNPQVGKNLHIHPCNFVSSTHKEDVRPWEGGIITSVCTEFENLDGKGHGIKLEPTCMVPYAILPLQPWSGGLDAKYRMLSYRHLNGFISLTRDRDTGSVFMDPETGEPRINYVVSDFDRAHTLEGVQALAKLCYVSGASEIRAHFPEMPTFIAEDGGAAQRAHVKGTDPEFTDAAFGAWLRRVREVGNKPPVSVWSSAHQMGTCRMSGSSDRGVVDGGGRVWGRKNLYVADASVFPSASGVNPMMTLMSLADWISRGVVRDLAKDG